MTGNSDSCSRFSGARSMCSTVRLPGGCSGVDVANGTTLDASRVNSRNRGSAPLRNSVPLRFADRMVWLSLVSIDSTRNAHRNRSATHGEAGDNPPPGPSAPRRLPRTSILSAVGRRFVRTTTDRCQRDLCATTGFRQGALPRGYRVRSPSNPVRVPSIAASGADVAPSEGSESWANRTALQPHPTHPLAPASG